MPVRMLLCINTMPNISTFFLPLDLRVCFSRQGKAGARKTILKVDRREKNKKFTAFLHYFLIRYMDIFSTDTRTRWIIGLSKFSFLPQVSNTGKNKRPPLPPVKNPYTLDNTPRLEKIQSINIFKKFLKISIFITKNALFLFISLVNFDYLQSIVLL